MTYFLDCLMRQLKFVSDRFRYVSWKGQHLTPRGKVPQLPGHLDVFKNELQKKYFHFTSCKTKKVGFPKETIVSFIIPPY